MFRSLWRVVIFLPFLAASSAAQLVPVGTGAAAAGQSVQAALGASTVGALSDFVASGTITYFWAGKPVQGSATARGRGAEQFRLDANLPEGARSWAVNRGKGALREADGKLTRIPYHNAVGFGSLTFPYLKLGAALNDPAQRLTDLGVAATGGGVPLRQIHYQKVFSAQIDPDGTLAKLSAADYFLDAQTNLVVKITNLIHPTETFNRSYSHEIDFENYTTSSGVAVPMLVRERIDGQTIWELQLSSISFNRGLSDPDFTIQ